MFDNCRSTEECLKWGKEEFVGLDQMITLLLILQEDGREHWNLRVDVCIQLEEGLGELRTTKHKHGFNGDAYIWI